MKREFKKRTEQQNKALHLFFEHLAIELNLAGLPIKKVLEKSVDIDWSAESCKEILWKPIQKAVLNKSSTTELDKIAEIDLVWEHLNRFLAEFGVFVPFPHDPSILKDTHYQ